MKIKNLLLIGCLIVLASCSNNAVFHKFDEINESNQWAQSDAKTFDFTIEDDSALYDITFQFSHVYDYQFPTVPINFSLESPDGNKEDFAVDMTIKDSSGKDIGDCVGDVCDMTYKVKEKVKLQKGTYKITISNSFNGPYLPNVIGIGLEVSKAK